MDDFKCMVVLTFDQVEIDTLKSLVNVKLKEFKSLKKRHVKSLNAIAGSNYVEDYVRCLNAIKLKLEQFEVVLK